MEYKEETVQAVAKALYNATKQADAASWNRLVELAKFDTTGAQMLQFWYGLAIAALDLTEGARARRWS